jgi:hypothetical protein
MYKYKNSNIENLNKNINEDKMKHDDLTNELKKKIK